MGIFKKIAEKLDKTADKKIADVVDKAVPPKPKPKQDKKDGQR